MTAARETHSRPALQIGRLLIWVGLVLAGIFFLTTGGAYDGIASIGAHITGQVIAIVVLGGWCALAIVRPAWRPSTPLLFPVLLACLAYLASAAFSQRPRLSFEPTIAGLGWAFAFLFLGRLLADQWFRARAFVLMVAFVTVVSVGYIAQVLLEWITWWNLIGRLAIPPLRPSFAGLFLGSPNLIGTALILLAPLVVAVLWGRGRRVFALVIGGASIVAVFLCGSRGAWLGAGLGVVVALALAALRGGLRSRLGEAIPQIRRRPLLLVPIGLAAAALLALMPSVLLRFAQGGGTLRLDLWRAALTIFGEHPVFGGGPGTWVQLKVEASPEGVPNLIFPHAHNLYLQAAAEVGVVGLVALAILTIAVLHRLRQGWRSAGGARSGLRLETAAVTISLLAFAGQSLVDNLVNLPFVCLLLVAIVAWVDGRLADASEPTAAEARGAAGTPSMARSIVARAPLAAVVAGLVVLGATLPTLLRIDRAASLSSAGSDAALKGHWSVALEAYDSARREDPGFTLYEIQAAGALSRLGRTQEARDLLAVAVEADPVATNLIGLAALEADLGHAAEARALAARARAFGIGDAFVALNAALIGERIGDATLALDAFADAVAITPALAASGLWASPSRLVDKADVVAEARTRVDELGSAIIVAYAGDTTTARSLLQPMPPSDRRDVYLAAADWLEFHPDLALARLDERLRADPSNWYVAAWASRIARLSDDPRVAADYARWALIVAADAAQSVLPESGVVPAGHDSAKAGLPGDYPWAVYLRPDTPYLLVRSLTLIGTR